MARSAQDYAGGRSILRSASEGNTRRRHRLGGAVKQLAHARTDRLRCHFYRKTLSHAAHPARMRAPSPGALPPQQFTAEFGQVSKRIRGSEQQCETENRRRSGRTGNRAGVTEETSGTRNEVGCFWLPASAKSYLDAARFASEFKNFRLDPTNRLARAIISPIR